MKTKLRFLLPVLLLCAGLTFISACGGNKLAPGGAYAPGTFSTDTNGATVFTPSVQPDIAFYKADVAYDLAYSTIDAAFKFEFDNRALLWTTSPSIKHALDAVRPQAVAVNLEWAKARQAYMANPVPANLSTLQTVLAKIQQLSLTAQAALPK